MLKSFRRSSGCKIDFGLLAAPRGIVRIFREQRGVLAFPAVFHKRRDTAPDILQGLFREFL